MTITRSQVCRVCGAEAAKGGLCRSHRVSQAPLRVPAAELLWMECWCGRAVIEAPKEIIGIDGVSCGADDCR